MLEEVIIQQSSPFFSNIMDSEYNNRPTRAIEYTIETLDVKHLGIIHAFRHNGRSFLISKQEAEEDINVNKAGFDEIERSLIIQ